MELCNYWTRKHKWVGTRSEKQQQSNVEEYHSLNIVFLLFCHGVCYASNVYSLIRAKKLMFNTNR